jgi:thiamine-monophosphate kinase
MATRFTEDEIIARLFAPLAGEGAFGLRDDAALLPPSPDDGLVVTTDALVAGVHFFADDPPALIAQKALRVNLSDLAAKGAAPIGFLLALALPKDWTNDWLADFARGLGADARDYSCPLLGGDTVATPGPLTLSITALGRASRNRFVSRTGAAPGDVIYVSGTIGDAALGLVIRRAADRLPGLSESARSFLTERYLLPQPRLTLAEALREHASAAMDVSDGLAGDLAKLALASKASAVVDIASVPLSAAAREAIALEPDLLEAAMTGGDDYEVLCCVRGDAQAFERAARAAGTPVTKIGEVIAGDGPPIFRDGKENIIYFNKLSYRHF